MDLDGAISAVKNKSFIYMVNENMNARQVIELFHSLPHLNMWFAPSNSTFNPNDSDYLETILFWSTVPILLLILLLLILIIYACCLVCTSNSSSIKLNDYNHSRKKNKKLCHLKAFISFFVLILSIALAFLVFGSENFHHSFSDVTMSIRQFSSHFAQITNKTQEAKTAIYRQMNETLSKFEHDMTAAANRSKSNSFNNYNINRQLNVATNELVSIRSALNDSYRSLEPLNRLENENKAYNSILNQIDTIEQTRWAIMIGVVTVNMLLILLLLIGLIRNSKGSLCFFAFAGVLSLISIWVLNALYLGITVFIADFCMQPNHYILTVAERNYMRNLVHYYTSCPSQNQLGDGYSPMGRGSHGISSKYMPFRHDINRAESKLRTAVTLYNDNLVRMAQSIMDEEEILRFNFTISILSVENILDNIRSLIRCDKTSTSYNMAVNYLCYNSIFGLAFVVLSSTLFGLILPILICIIPQLWRRMHGKDIYDSHYHGSSGGHGNTHHHNHLLTNVSNDETHPFLSGLSAQNARSNMSAARQFNESPTFQRLTNASSSGAATSQASSSNRSASLSRSRHHKQSAANSSVLATAPIMNSRIDESTLANADPYQILGSNGNQNSHKNPSAPPLNVYQSYYIQTPTQSMGAATMQREASAARHH